MVDETQGSGGVGRGSSASTSGPGGAGAAEPVVEDNGPWWGVFLVIFIFLFASATAFLVHSLSVTFG